MGEGPTYEETIDIASLQCIKVPCMTDIGCCEPDPLATLMELNILDFETSKLEQTNLLADNHDLKIERARELKEKANAMHINMRASKVEISLGEGASWRNLPFQIDGKTIKLEDNV